MLELLPIADAFSKVDQQYLLEARQMQALSLGIHIPLVCFGVAFPAIVLFMEGMYHRTGKVAYRQIAKRWSKVMLILFAVGVVTGTILSFELGILWPRFMEEFGEVFGLAFALEGLSFFIEAIFITIYVYGWDKLSEKAHFLVGIPIVITGLTGSFLVITVNGWMNNPTGFDIVNDEVTNVRPMEALFNSYFWHEWFHMYVAGFIVAGFLVAGVYAYAWLKGNRDHYHRAALIVPLTVACIAAPVQLLMGDWAGREVADTQPVKLAAFEGLDQTEKGADFNIGGIYWDGENHGGINIPDMLSLLAYHDPNATVEGLDSVPADDRPPVAVVRNAFSLMVAIGTGLVVLAAWYLLTWFRRARLPRSKWFYRLVTIAGPAAFVALIAGWIVTEVGRQPWIVYEVMRVEEAVTGAEGIPVGYATLAAVYLGLIVVVFWLLRRLARQPVEQELPREAGS
jgi:cytochrome d ubiquinol oxidase subunit I